MPTIFYVPHAIPMSALLNSARIPRLKRFFTWLAHKYLRFEIAALQVSALQLSQSLLADLIHALHIGLVEIGICISSR
jgi:hypothetical protein